MRTRFHRRTQRWAGIAFAAMATAVLSLPATANATTGSTVLVSVSTTGGGSGAPNADSTRPAADVDGNLVTFASKATDLVTKNNNGYSNVYVRNIAARTTTMVSVSDTGGPSNGNSTFPDISEGGQYVVFESDARNLVTNPVSSNNVYRTDLSTGQTVLVSVNYAGGTTNGSSTRPSISADGRYVAFTSEARNLVLNDSAPKSVKEVYVRDMNTGTTVRASVSVTGGDPNASSTRGMISADGTHVAFISLATNLIAADTNTRQEVFERDLVNNVTHLVSVAADGSAANGLATRPAVSATGQYVAFQSTASNLIAGDTNNVVDIFRRDMSAGVTIRVSVSWNGGQLTAGSTRASISEDGNIVAFASNDRHVDQFIRTANRNVFFRNVSAGTTTLASISDTGGAGSCSTVTSAKGCLATRPAVSGDGTAVAFLSTFNDLTPDVTTGAANIFERIYR